MNRRCSYEVENGKRSSRLLRRLACFAGAGGMKKKKTKKYIANKWQGKWKEGQANVPPSDHDCRHLHRRRIIIQDNHLWISFSLRLCPNLNPSRKQLCFHQRKTEFSNSMYIVYIKNQVLQIAVTQIKLFKPKTLNMLQKCLALGHWFFTSDHEKHNNKLQYIIINKVRKC